jgi:hypothetical protein
MQGDNRDLQTKNKGVMIELELISENEDTLFSVGKNFFEGETVISIRQKDSVFPICFYLSESELRYMMFHFKQVLEKKEFLEQQKKTKDEINLHG